VRLTTATIAAMGRACAVRFQGFVTVSMKCRGARAGRNPLTGAHVAPIEGGHRLLIW
jgi:nucleoid DNA-binding protein